MALDLQMQRIHAGVAAVGLGDLERLAAERASASTKV